MRFNLLCGYITIYCCALKRKHTIELKYQTLPLMGATRPALGKMQLYLIEYVFSTFSYPDAGRVAPISACVFCSTFQAT